MRVNRVQLAYSAAIWGCEEGKVDKETAWYPKKIVQFVVDRLVYIVI